MKCGNCDKTDGLCYTSNPPKVKCTVTGNFHEYDDECEFISATIDVSTKATICTNCIICDESIELTKWEEEQLTLGHHMHSKVCDKCKQAITHIRTMIECEIGLQDDKLFR